jgi:UDP-N-acetylmuramate dehydrogenase
VALQIVEPASLKTLNSFGVEAGARRLMIVDDPADLAAALAQIRHDARVLVIGGGTNLLLAGDFDGTVLRIALRGRRIVGRTDGEALVEAAAGENWHAFVGWTLDQGLSGLENLALIPGTVGASPIQNIGAYGVEMRERFDSLDAVDRHTGQRYRFESAECRFGYRDSLFKHAEGARFIITAVRFHLSAGFEPRLGYGEVLAELGADAPRDRALGAQDVARAVIAIRQRKLPDPALLGNAGSFFRNPVVDAALAQALSADHPGMPRYPAGHGESARVKLSAGWMIEQCGWKGYRAGDAGVHERHALVLVNHGSATGAQVLALAERIRDSVARRYGVTLQPEPTIVR